MNPEELMIGDWYYWEAEGKKYSLQVTKEIFSLANEDVANFQPIPVTSEILEKNEFKEDFEHNGIYWRPDCRKFCIVKELDTWYFAFRVLSETVDKSSGYICVSKCNYVHKLQHILKDLEIEKEIII